MRVAGVRATLRRLDRETVSGWYAFLVESKGSRAGSWTAQGGSTDCHLASAGGIRDGVQISARDFGREMLDTFLDDLVAEQRGRAESWMYEDDDDVRLRIRVWDIGWPTGIASVPAARFRIPTRRKAACVRSSCPGMGVSWLRR